MVGILGLEAPQHRLDALHHQALRERLGDVVVGAHLEAEQLVDLLVLGGEEDHRHVGLLAQAAQQLHAVHARHLDVEDRQVGGLLAQRLEGGGAVAIGAHLVALRLQRHAERGEDVALVVDQSDRAFLFHATASTIAK